ncbi:resolvase [Serratia marcescens]|uniref:recombinase family protein n=1 Tax=Serratia marcescens TaxID=615 RepID=UPI00062C965F|nr:recombinase family protein [Serratia marcescens]KKZ19016.1 resolvase [Serratia marcescens]
MKAARIYERVSTDEQDLTRQASLEKSAIESGYYIAGIYREKASGATVNRPELQRMIADLQPGDVVIAEKIDRISRLPLPEAEKLIASIRAKGAKLAIPGIVDFSELAATTDGYSRIVLESMQELLLKLALQMARDDYETRRERQYQGIQLAKSAGKYKGRKEDKNMHQRIIALRQSGSTIHRTAAIAGCSISQVKRIWAMHQASIRSADPVSEHPDSICN